MYFLDHIFSLAVLKRQFIRSDSKNLTCSFFLTSTSDSFFLEYKTLFCNLCNPPSPQKDQLVAFAIIKILWKFFFNHANDYPPPHPKFKRANLQA